MFYNRLILIFLSVKADFAYPQELKYGKMVLVWSKWFLKKNEREISLSKAGVGNLLMLPGQNQAQ